MRRHPFAAVCLFIAAVSAAQTQPVVLQVSTLLDGRGNVIHNTRIVVEQGKIARIDPKVSPVTYDLSGLTVLPGWIDTHVHIDWHFGPNGKLGDKDETPEQASLAYASNAWKTLQAGFTTVQRPLADKLLQQAMAVPVDGDPLTDITAVRRIVFVMKGGRVYRNEVRAK